MDSDTASPIAGPLSWVLASIAAIVGIAPLLALGLVIPPQLIVPVAALAGGLLAGLVSSWIRNAFTSDSSSRLLTVVGVTAAAALVVAVGMFLCLMFLPVPIIVYLLIAALILGGVAAWAAWRFRSPNRNLGRDALVSLGLLVAGALVIMAVLFGFCGTLLTCSAYSGPT
ncbi:hypothetical protein [Microlunatus speluncae]|uniref:hypothetical protein n=1 Tax=Microlunatus speluncae TaxID=2594267 RepID=UPI0012666A94|nr:hypothetical protein [Microlunatus speluncae]